MGRHEEPIDEAEKAGLRALLVRYNGNLSAMAKALGLPNRQGLSRRLARFGLAKEADQARAAAAVKGPRPQLEEGSEEEQLERERVIGAIAQHGGYRSAAVALGLSPRTMMRRMQSLGVTPEDVELKRAALRASE